MTADFLYFEIKSMLLRSAIMIYFVCIPRFGVNTYKYSI